MSLVITLTEANPGIELGWPSCLTFVFCDAQVWDSQVRCQGLLLLKLALISQIMYSTFILVCKKAKLVQKTYR